MFIESLQSKDGEFKWINVRSKELRDEFGVFLAKHGSNRITPDISQRSL